MTKKLEGKVALVTGASTGMGRAAAIRFAEEGANVVVVARREQEGQETVHLVEATGTKAKFLSADVTNYQQMEDVVAKTMDVFGRLDFAFNNAGSGINQKITDFRLEDWNTEIGVNLTGVFYGIKAQIPAMIENGGGSIVNMASQTALVASPGYGPYAAAKAGVIALSRAAAVEYADQNIRVNSVSPGVVATDILKSVPDSLLQRLRASIPLGREGQPEEVASFVVYLCLPEAAWLTGQNFVLDGGFTAGRVMNRDVIR